MSRYGDGKYEGCGDDRDGWPADSPDHYRSERDGPSYDAWRRGEQPKPASLYASLIGDEQPAPASLDAMRMQTGDGKPGEWYAYQNHDLGHGNLGHLQFLRCGEGCTHTTPPDKAPDSVSGFGWRYQPVGRGNLETGLIEETS